MVSLRTENQYGVPSSYCSVEMRLSPCISGGLRISRISKTVGAISLMSPRMSV